MIILKIVGKCIENRVIRAPRKYFQTIR